MKGMGQDTRLTLLHRIPVMVLSLLSMTLLTRWLGPEGNGIYTFILANINLLLLLLGWQSETAVLHYMSRPEEDVKKQATLGLLFIPVSTLVCALLLWAAGNRIPSFRQLLIPAGQPYVYFLWFIILSFLFRKSLNTALAMLRATLQFRPYNRLQWISQLIPALAYSYGFFIVAKAKHAAEVVSVFDWILVGQAIIAILSLAMAFRQTGVSWSVKPLIKPFLTYSAKSTVDGMAKFINRRIDIYFVQAFRGAGALGQYGLASQITNFAQEIIHPFTQVMNPYLVKANHEERHSIIARMCRIILSVTLLLTAGIILLTPVITPILFGKAFAPSIAATQILALAVFISTMRIIFASYFQSVNRLQFNIRSNWLGVIFTIVLDILLIPAYGIEGAAVASVLAYSVSMGYLFSQVKRELHLTWKDMLILKREDIRWFFHKDQDPV